MRRTALLAVVLLLAASPGFASSGAAQDATVPTTPGDEVTLAWTGSALPGAEQGDCQEATSDAHDITLGVPDGAYDAVRVAARFDVTYDGPATDVKFTLVAPDGTATTADNGFADEDETLAIGNPVAGTYRVLVCTFASATPQAYDGMLTLTAEAIVPSVASGPACPSPGETMKWEMGYIDETRAGGEPIVQTLPDGTLVWGSHAGTTHFFTPGVEEGSPQPFVENYRGQTYDYYSEDGGATWTFVPRQPVDVPPAVGVPATGFSDPEFAVDAAGNVYTSEINLANVAVWKSTDSGRSYGLQNVFSFTSSDRQWMAADEEDVLYMTANGFGGGSFPSGPVGNLGHFIAKSTDGGVTWSAPDKRNPNGVADIQVDRRDGTVYEISASADGTLAMAAWRGARGADGMGSDPEIGTIADGVGYTGVGRLIDPTFDMDEEGNLYIVWTENGTGAAGRPPGIYYSYSLDRGRTWASPAIRVDPDARTDIWPWITVGEPGQVAISYLAVDAELENNNAELAEDDQGWNVVTAHTQYGLGCPGADEASQIPGFTYSSSTSEPIHFGTICQGGTLCQAELVDRRLGDYFANETNAEGDVYISVADTRQGGPTALPLNVRQVGGPNLFDLPEEPEEPGEPGQPPAPEVDPCEVVPDGEVVRRVATNDPTALGVALSEGCFDSADTAVLARSDDFADALAAGGLAGELDAPVLLTPTEGLDDAVAAELDRLGVEDVVLVGGEAALSAQVAADVEALGMAVRRIGGRERFSTAGLVADAIVEIGGPVEEVIVALGIRPEGGDAWPDALAAGVLAAAARAPVLLTAPEAVPFPTDDALARLLDAGDPLLIAGGTAAVGTTAQDELLAAGYAPRRIAGATRYGTAAAMAEEAVARGATTDVVVLASGEEFAGALVGGPAAVRAGGILLLAQPEDLDFGTETRAFLEARRDAIDAVVLAGGTEILSEAVERDVRTIFAGRAGEAGGGS